MRKILLYLYDEMLKITVAQKKALQGGNLEEALKLQKERKTIMEKLPDFDVKSKVKIRDDSHEWKNKGMEKSYSQIKETIEKIVSLDGEIRNFICSELDSISEKLGLVKNMKAFAHNAAPSQSGKNLRISA